MWKSLGAIDVYMQDEAHEEVVKRSVLRPM
jgi:hypothetical protein